MTLLRESYLYQLWLVLCTLYHESALYRILMRVKAWCRIQMAGSRIVRPLCREGAVARLWPDSFICRSLTALLNLPGCLLHQLYCKFQVTFEDSFFARLAFELGESTAIAQSWLIMLLWIIPFSRWNNAYSLMGFTALLVLFHAGAMRRKTLRLDVKQIGIYPVLFFVAVFLGAVCSYDPSLSMRFLIYHVSAALCVLLTVSAVRNGEDLKRLTIGGAVCVAVSGAYGIVQRVQGIEVNASYVDLTLNQGMPGRVYSFFDNPNTFAQVMILLLPLVLALVLCSKSLFGKLLACVTLMIGVGALGMTYSRASWIGAACAVAVFVFLWKPRYIPALLLLCCLAVPLLPQTIWNRMLTIGNLEDSSTTSRFPLYEAALEVIRTSPISGAGLGTAAVQAYIKEHGLYRGVSPFVHAHNMYLQIWIEAGLLGIIGFVGAMVWNIKRTLRLVRSSADSSTRTIVCAATAAMCGAMV